MITNEAPKLTRRNFLKTALAMIGGAAFAGGTYAWQIEPRWVEFMDRELPIRHLHDSLVGTSLVQISDMHIGNRYDWRYQISAFQKMAASTPEFVVYTGDFITYETAQQIEQLHEALSSAPHGTRATVAILGNHDYGHNWRMPEVAQSVAEALGQHDILVLRNEKASFHGLDIVGLDDFWATNYDPQPVLASVDAHSPSIVLCHNPDVVDEPVWSGYKGWILAGHTHGGQVKPPFLPPPILPVRNPSYTAGTFYLEDGRHLYINRGLGNLLPVRFNARPEITIFTLSNATPFTFPILPIL